MYYQVPQGSVQGPTLYFIFTAGLPTIDKVVTSTIADDTEIFSSPNSPVIASVELNSHLKRMKVWFNNSRIRIIELKTKHVGFTSRKGDCSPVFFNNIKLPHESKAVYLGIHLNRRLTWRSHIETKKKRRSSLKHSSLTG